jgi:serine/threonine protein kinase
VAVKIAKSTNELEVFKAVLSEVKIMIYLGHAHNVVNLLGVCTQDIRNRKIHIILELCEKGSLQKFLRGSKPNFLNLLSDFTTIEADWAEASPPTNTVTTTLDLVRWSGEIANGMSHLANNGVNAGYSDTLFHGLYTEDIYVYYSCKPSRSFMETWQRGTFY